MENDSKSGFGTITLIAIIVLALVTTGIGQALWRHSTQIGAYCRDAALSVNLNAALDSCDALGQSIVAFQRHLEHLVGGSSFGDTMNLEEFSGFIAREFSNRAIGFQNPALSDMINPNLLSQGGNLSMSNPLDRLSVALTQGAQGNQLLKGGNIGQGLGFLQSSAAMGDVGLLSQLQLGSAYANGTAGVPADPARAKAYFNQALQSINSLQSSNNPASQSLLGALPVPADQMKTQLQGVIAQ